MKQLKLFFALFAMLALGVGNAWADVNCDFTTKSASHGAYTDSWKYGDFTVFGGANNNKGWPYVKMGGKQTNLATANPVYISSPKVTSAISKVQVSIIAGSLPKTGMSVNSWGVYVYSDANMTNQVDYVAGGTISKNAAVFEFTPTTGTTWSANNYYKVSFDLKNTTTTNGIIWLDKVTFVESTNGGGETTDPTCTEITPKLSYESTTLLTSTKSSAPTLDGNTGEGTVTYTSSNTEVAKVDAKTGVITAVNAGTTTITATIAETGEYCEGMATVDITVKQLVSCADIYDLADDATFVLKDFVVTYVNGDYTYIKDATGYGVIYKNSYGLQAGDQVASGKLEGKKDTYKGLVEIIPTTTAADLNATPGTAPEPEVMDAAPVEGDMNKYAKFEGVTFASTAFSSNSITGNFGGESITFYNTFGTSATFDTSKKYNVVGCVSIYNTLQVNFISAEEVAESTLNVKVTNADFGKIAINGKAERTLTLNGSRLTNTVALAIEGEGAEHFKLSSNSVDPTDGNITNAKITITYKPTAEGTHTATLKITSDDVAGQTITLTGQAAQEYTVHFYVNGEEDETLKKTVLSGNTLEELPEATSCDQINYPTFAGWASDAIDGTTDVKPTMLDLSTPITSECNYYAVFAKGTTSSGSTTSAIMKYTGRTTTNMNDGNNATIVGLDETLFNITSTKTASGTHVGLNKNNDIRLYANKKNDGNGNILTISMLDGSSITKITLDIKQEANFVVKANGKSITGADNVYTIDYPSCSIQNTTTGATTQLHLNSVTIEYTTSTTTYEYITSCAVVVPTCEITYDYADGEGECTNDIVEEGAEYTLCATAPTKAGHTFLNWKDQSDNDYEAGATITVSKDLTLTAQWQINSYKVTWMSLGEEVSSANVEYNSQPTKPAEDPTYTCLSGTKEFVGWTTQEIDGVGVPANLYTDEFPVVTEPITYYAVFAGKSAEASITTNTLLVTEKLGNYTSGNMKDDQQSVWNYFAGGLEDGETLYLALRNKESETSYIESPKFTGTVQSIVAHVKNGSGSKVRTVYLRSSATAQPTEGDLGETSIPAFENREVTLNITPSFDKFFIQVSDGLQFHKIVVTSGIAAGAYIDYITSCEAVTSSITIEDVAMNVGDTHTINATITPAAAESAVTYTIKENTENAISLSGNTITALAEGTATITATIEDAANYTGTTVDFTVTVNPAPVTDKVVILAQYDGKWYAMKAEYLSDNTDRLVGVLVNYIDGKLYEVDDAIKPLIEWDRTTSVDNVTFQNNSKYLKGKTTTVLNLEAEATGLYQWNSDYTMVLSGSSTVRTFMYNGEAFRNFAVSNAGKVVNEVLYSELPVVTAPVYATGLIIGEGVNTLTDGETKDVVISRSFTADALYTISLPFALDALQVEAIFGTGTTLYQFSGLEQADKELVMRFSNVTAIAAATPYLIKPAQNVDPGTLVEDVTIEIDPVNIEFTAGATTVTMKPILSATEEQTNGDTQYWLATDNYLYNNVTQLLSLRALFEMTTVSGMPPRCRAEFSENEETALDYISTTDAPIKVIENGQLIIIRDGEMYNAMGVKL